MRGEGYRGVVEPAFGFVWRYVDAGFGVGCGGCVLCGGAGAVGVPCFGWGAGWCVDGVVCGGVDGYGGVFGYFDECTVVCVDIVDWFYGSGCECVAADGGRGGYGGTDPLGVDASVRL